MNVISVKYLRDYVLRLEFEDGTKGDVDLRDHLHGPEPLVALRDRGLFQRACVMDGTVAWPNGADLAVEFVYALAHGLQPPRTFEEAKANELEVSLRELRQMGDVRQEDLASSLSVTQGAVSRLEAGSDARVSTIRRYAKALGWEIEVVAVRGSRRVRLRGV